MTVMLIWTLDVDPERIDEALELVAERRVQVQRHSCRDLRIYRVESANGPAHRMVAIEEFDSSDDLASFSETQPQDAEAVETINRTFAPVGPFTVVDMLEVHELDAGGSPPTT